MVHRCTLVNYGLIPGMDAWGTGSRNKFNERFDMTPVQSVRRYEFDRLRIGATLMVFLYHSTRFFNFRDYFVKNAATYAWVEIWTVFAMNWLMPLFFIISGASLFYAMEQNRGWAEFLKNKFMRLMVPVLVASVTHSILQVYLQRLSHGHFSGSLVSFLPEYFNGVYLGVDVPGGNFAFQGLHLWYLLFLFIDSLICYGLFLWFKGRGSKILHRVTALLAVPGLMYLLFALPLMVMFAFIPPAVLNAGAGAWGFPYYIWFLISGFMIVSGERLQQSIMRQRWMSLLLGVTLIVVYLFTLFSPSHMVPPDGMVQWAHTFIYFLSAWCWLLAILGFGMRFLNHDGPLLQQTNEGVLPFYILHQAVLVVISYFVMAWEIHDLLKWAVVFTGSFIFIIAMYLFVIRPFDLFRFLFGMKTTRPFFNVFRTRWALIALNIMYVGLIVLAITEASRSRTPMPLTYDPMEDVIINCESISKCSSTGVHVVYEPGTSIGRAIEFISGANEQAQSRPQVYVETRFFAPAGRYTVWLRGKSDLDRMTDSVWLQVDEQIDTQKGSFRMGNWLDIHPAGEYTWAGDGDTPITIALQHTGNHTIRIQPRQTPHRIDQIWLSRFQHRIPDTSLPLNSGGGRPTDHRPK